MKRLDDNRDYSVTETSRLELFVLAEAAELDTETAARIAADAALQTEVDAAETDILAVQGEVDAAETRLDTLEALKMMRQCGEVTLNGTSPAGVSTVFVLSDPALCHITLTRRGYGSGTAGRPAVEDGTIVDGSKFYVVSDDGGDDGVLLWAVFA